MWTRPVIEVPLWVRFYLLQQDRDIPLSAPLDQVKEPILLPHVIKSQLSRVEWRYSRSWLEDATLSPWRVIDILNYFIRVSKRLHYVLRQQVDPFEEIGELLPFALSLWLPLGVLLIAHALVFAIDIKCALRSIFIDEASSPGCDMGGDWIY